MMRRSLDRFRAVRDSEHIPRLLWTHTSIGAAVITDLLCVLLPMMVFRTLQASLRDKVAVFIILGLGFL